ARRASPRLARPTQKRVACRAVSPGVGRCRCDRARSKPSGDLLRRSSQLRAHGSGSKTLHSLAFLDLSLLHRVVDSPLFPEAPRGRAALLGETALTEPQNRIADCTLCLGGVERRLVLDRQRQELAAGVAAEALGELRNGELRAGCAGLDERGQHAVPRRGGQELRELLAVKRTG